MAKNELNLGITAADILSINGATVVFTNQALVEIGKAIALFQAQGDGDAMAIYQAGLAKGIGIGVDKVSRNVIEVD